MDYHDYCSDREEYALIESVDVDSEQATTQEQSDNLEALHIIQKTGDELLIDMIKSYPFLYKKQLKEYKDKNMKENAWEEIASCLNVTVSECQTRWLRLRQYYAKERQKREQECRSGSKGGSQRKGWELFELLSFLEDHITKRKTFGNIHHLGSISDDNRDSLRDSQEMDGTESSSVEIVSHTESSSGTTVGGTESSSGTPVSCYFGKRKKIKVDPIESAFSRMNSTIQSMADKLTSESTPTVVAEDDNDLVGKLVAAELKKATRERNEEIKRKIFEIIYKK
ncbi:unnamed protein product [Phaedon cochleariae]|uniref:MADF domain-containing protein n=1 Tax=Phaedon cochleariae TaxID=80249 RepID=A0A9N9X450_PHACE|nr:unnamed protein product [Phaedon cochleariae]